MKEIVKRVSVEKKAVMPSQSQADVTQHLALISYQC